MEDLTAIAKHLYTHNWNMDKLLLLAQRNKIEWLKKGKTLEKIEKNHRKKENYDMEFEGGGIDEENNLDNKEYKYMEDDETVDIIKDDNGVWVKVTQEEQVRAARKRKEREWEGKRELTKRLKEDSDRDMGQAEEELKRAQERLRECSEQSKMLSDLLAPMDKKDGGVMNSI